MDPKTDYHPTEGKPADKPNEPTLPETGGHRIHPNDAEPVVMRRHQEMADNARDPHGEKRADTAKSKRHHQTDRKRKTQCDDMQALLHRFRGERIEVAAGPLCGLP